MINDFNRKSIFPVNPCDLDLDINVGNTGTVNIDFGGGSGHVCKVLYDTKENWNAHPDMIARRGFIYVYSNYKVDEEGRNIAGMKVGDGVSYLIDMAFDDELYADHINDVSVHITEAEREFWNNKVRCYIDEVVDGENIIFTTH